MPSSGKALVKIPIVLGALIAVLLLCIGGASIASGTDDLGVGPSAGTSAVGSGAETQASGTDWTVLIYMDADNNLEPYMISNFLEMATVGSDDEVNIVVQMDRIGGNDARYEDWTGCYRFLVTAGMTPTAANRISNIGEVNMASGNVFTSFIEWGITTYPANRYMVVLKDHGSSWEGCCQDYTSGSEDLLDLTEMKKGFDKAVDLTGGPIDLVLFDDCLMGSIEVATEYVDLIDYAVVSETVGWTNNYDYSDVLGYLTADTTRPTRDVAVGFAGMMNLVDSTSYTTQCAAAYDMRKVPELRNAFINFTVELYRCYNESYMDVYLARTACQDMYFTGEDDQVIDLYQFVDRSIYYGDDPLLTGEGRALMDLLDPDGTDLFIIKERHTTVASFCHGMNIYFPSALSKYDGQYHFSGYCGSESTYHLFLLNYLYYTPPFTSISVAGTEGDDDWYVSPVTVSLSAADTSGGGIDRTEYSFDGENWTTYTAPFAIVTDGNHTIHYRSVDNEGNWESAKELMLKMDRTDPIVSAEVDGYAVTISSTDACSGVVSVMYRVDGGAWTAYAGPFVPNAAGWLHEVEFYCTDAAGNPSMAGSINVYSEDTIAPVTTSTPSGTEGSNGWYTSSVSVSLSSSDAVSGTDWTSYSIDGGDWTTYVQALAISTDGDHSIQFRSMDFAGNLEGIRTLTFRIDRTDPMISANVYGYSVTLTYEDACSGVAVVHYRIDGGVWTAYTGPFIAGEDGWFHDLEYESIDAAGNPSVIGSVTIGTSDDFAPVTTSRLSGISGYNGWYVSTVILSLISTDDGGSGVKASNYSMNGGPWTSYASGISFAASGTYTVRYYSEDNFGNVESERSVTFKIDLGDPVVSIDVSGPGTGGYHNGNVTISVTSFDVVSGVNIVLYRINGGGWTTYSGGLTLTKEGSYLVEFYARDKAGNAANVKYVEIVIDLTAPVPSIDARGINEDGWGNGSAYVDITSEDALSTVSSIMYRINAGEWTAYSSSIMLDSEGTHIIESYAVDGAGNIGPTSSVTCRIDTTSPEAVLIPMGMLHEGDHVNNVTVTMTFSDEGSGVLAAYYRIDGGEWLVYDGVIKMNEAGEHVIEYYAVDLCNNTCLVVSYELSVIEATEPGQVTGLLIKEGGSFLVLNWTAPSDGGLNMTFNVYRSEDGGEMTLIATVEGMEYVDHDVGENVEYDYCIAAVNPLGEGPSSAIESGLIEGDDMSATLMMVVVVASIASVIILAAVLILRKR